MSVSDPAIKDLKSCIKKFLQEPSGKIEDEHRFLSSFCQKLENIFYNGLKNVNKLFTKDAEPFDWMLEITKDKNWKFPFHYTNSLYKIQHSEDFPKTKLGKLRLLVRFCLAFKCLHVPVEYLLKNNKSSLYYYENSILGDEILSEILLSLFLQCGHIHFDLKLENFHFLETTWLLPDVWTVGLVPSNSLGVSVIFSEEKAVIVEIDLNGPAAESEKIEVGDILENINGIQINSSSRGKLHNLMKKQKSQPLQLTIIKALKESDDNNLFIPIRKYLLDVNLDILTIQNRRKGDGKPEAIKEVTREGFRCIFIGHVKIGMEGDSKQIEKTIRDITKFKDKSCNRYNKHVYCQIGELGLKIVDPESGKVLFNHAYMDISSCGSSNMYYNYFGYIKGNDRDDPGIFTCYIFHTKNKEDLAMILSSIGQGFKRTTFAV